MKVELNALKDDCPVVVENFDTEYDYSFVQVSDLKDALAKRPDDIGKVWLAAKVKYALHEDLIKEALEEVFDQVVVPADNFVYHEDFTVDELWDKETLPKIKKLLDEMLSESGFFMTKTDVEVDCSWTIQAYKEARNEN